MMNVVMPLSSWCASIAIYDVHLLSFHNQCHTEEAVSWNPPSPNIPSPNAPSSLLEYVILCILIKRKIQLTQGNRKITVILNNAHWILKHACDLNFMCYGNAYPISARFCNFL